MIPPKLKQGDTIAVFSPSSPATATAAERYLRGKKYIESKGFNFIEGKLTGKVITTVQVLYLSVLMN